MLLLSTPCLLQPTDSARGKAKILSLLLHPSQLLHSNTPQAEQGCYMSQLPPQEYTEVVLGSSPRSAKDTLAVLPFSVQAHRLLCNAPFSME